MTQRIHVRVHMRNSRRALTAVASGLQLLTSVIIADITTLKWRGLVSGLTSAPFIINAFVECCSGHQSPGLWQHPQDKSFNFNDVKHWVELAKLLEKGNFHGMFIADVLVGIIQKDLANISSKLIANGREYTMSIKGRKIQILRSYLVPSVL